MSRELSRELFDGCYSVWFPNTDKQTAWEIWDKSRRVLTAYMEDEDE